MKRFVLLFMIVMLALLVMPAIAHQVQPVEVMGLAMDSASMPFAIDTDCLDLKIEQSTPEKIPLILTSDLFKNQPLNTIEPLAKWESTGGFERYSYVWTGNIGYNSMP